MSSTADLAPGTEIAGHRIESVAGRGGMGVVYRATQLRLKRTVALKVIAAEYAGDDTFRARFEHESEIAAQIEHPHVIPLYEAGEQDDLLFITMRYVEGTDLKALIARKGALEPRLAARIMQQVCNALDAAHARGLVHRDIKPGNVLIAGSDDEPHAYLTDFGLTKQASAEGGGMTKTGMFVGTLDYIAPEQLQGKAVDARADVYALGCMLYQMLVGRVPYQRDSEPAKIWAHMSEPPPSITAAAPGVPQAFEEVIQRAMAKDPEQRYPSAGDLGRAAVAAAAGQQQISGPERSVAAGAAAPTAFGEAPTGAAPTAYGGAPTGAAPTAYGGVPTAHGGAPTGAGSTAFGGPPTGGGAAPTAYGGAPGSYPGSAPGAPAKRSRMPLIAGGIVAALVVIGVVVFLVAGSGGGGGGGGSEPEGNPAGRVVGEGAQLEVTPTDLSAGEGGVWLANGAEGNVTKVDTDTMEVTDIPMPKDAVVGDVAAGGGAVWVDTFADRITKLDPATSQTTDVSVPETREVRQLALDETTGTLWVLAPKKSTLTAVDTEKDKAAAPIDPGTTEGASMAAGDGFAYVVLADGKLEYASEDSNSIDGDPGTLALSGTEISDTDYQDGTLYPVVEENTIGKFDVTSGTSGTKIAVGEGFGAGAVQGDSLWAAYPADRVLKRFSIDTGEQIGDPIKLPRPPALMTADDTGIYVVSQGVKPTLMKVEPGDAG